MADQQEEEDLRMALRMSMQNSPPEPKRSKPRDTAILPAAKTPEESRQLQRELMAAAAEKRMLAAAKAAPPSSSQSKNERSGDFEMKEAEKKAKEVNLGNELSDKEAHQLFAMVFGTGVSKDILAQWSNQGIRFSPDPETSMGLVQHEGGPCGVLATIQAFVLKHLLFFPDELGKVAANMPQNLNSRRSKSQYVASNNFSAFTEDAKARALVKSMSEMLFLCGNNKRAVIATLSVISHGIEGSEGSSKDVIIAQALEGLSIESASDLQKVLRVDRYTSPTSAFKRLEAMIPIFQSRMGALLFLISALLSRGLDCVQADRDDPSQPLVTAPFGHASQEIVNLLLCGQAVPNVFDGRMDLGGGMFLKGIFTSVEVGFLTLLESLNFCKVGQNLKCPKWPIWVVGSESHYTVLFALDTAVQDENELEERESQIRKAFDAQDQSGGGGFISVEAFHQVLRETSIRLRSEKLDSLCNSGFIVWSEFWQVILDLDKNLGGLKDSTGQMGRKIFDLYHFNGIAKSDLNGSQATTEGSESSQKDAEVAKPEQPPQHAPLADCIRTRWPRAVCNWIGDPPSIV
ncbi:hypothetical protein ES319_D05G253900v1 [Gossypium barbadense]|uniref:ubiquitinyl hydrolase 1 n=2 Tax=Gossypium TaxID=3633 RepID=A0A5J5RHW7_GOSBA|nr:hypothetical protein ES319_D05G253900v1 [Gossypium barbadense]TYH72618.1 hypothetical protein ES332_D05G267000v1 [Gossypium tomentosum]